MKISYSNSLDDITAFVTNCEEYSPVRRALIRKTMVLIVAGSSLLTGLCAYPIFGASAIVSGLISGLFTGVLVAVVLYLSRFLPAMVDRHTATVAKKIMPLDKNGGVFCEHELEITDSELVERTEFGMSTIRLDAIEKIGAADGYTFIFTGTAAGHVIPATRVTRGDYEGFVSHLRARIVSIQGDGLLGTAAQA